MQILGINKAKSFELGAIVLDVDWSVEEGKVVETPLDKLERQKAKLQKEIDRLTDEEKQKLAVVVHKQSKAKRTSAHKMIAEALGEAKKGRPTKTTTAKRGRGRPRKYKKPEEIE